MNEKNIIDKLVADNYGYVVSIARKYTGRGVDLDDLVSEGAIGMLTAAKTFDASSGKRFVSYAAPFIVSAIERTIKGESSNVRLSVNEPIPVGSRNTMNLLRVLPDGNTLKVDGQLDIDSDNSDVAKLLALLNERERNVICGLYGIGSQRMTMLEVGEKYGLKRERVRQIRDVAMRKLGKASAILSLL